ncbi:MAG: tripartite tricarboxylate transporter substrate binding protein [Candidatus Competibacterales bacterium]
MWGAGGATDTVSRAIQPHVEAELGRDIIMSNRSGGVGAISTKYTHARRADGYTLLFGAENPQLHKVLGLATIDYDDFYPINVLARGIVVIVVPADSPYQTLEQLLGAIAAEPEQVKMGSTGPGGLPYVVSAMLRAVTDFAVTAVPYDGEGPGLTAMLAGTVDFMPAGLSAAAEHIRGGRARALAVLDSQPLAVLPDVPPVTGAVPEIARFLPWGPFYGVFVKRDTPQEAIDVLVDAFAKAAQAEPFVELMTERANVMMSLSGEEADQFLVRWRSVTAWLMHDAGATKRSPADFGIQRP